VKRIDCKQGSTEWFLARCGLPTASEFHNLITPEGKARTGEMPRTYLLKKVAERVMGYPAQSFGGGEMEQGSLLESEAVPFYEFTFGEQIQRVGFCTTDDGRIGCSPDGLLGTDGGIEIKCPQPHTHVGYLIAGVVPKEYVAQVQGSLFVTGRAWWTFLSYSRFFPPLIVRVEPDPAFQAALGAALKTFLTDFDRAEEAVRVIIAKNQPTTP
jgi:hypothetical protein